MFDPKYRFTDPEDYRRIVAKAKARPRIGFTAQNAEGETSTDGE